MAFLNRCRKPAWADTRPVAISFPRRFLKFLALAVCVLLLCRSAQAQSTSVSYVYDPLGRLVVAYDASGNAAVYHYDAVGNLLSITPDSANQFALTNLNQTTGSPGGTVAIYGTDFQSCTTLSATFDGVAASGVQVVNSTEILVTVPSGATTGSVVVTCNGVQERVIVKCCGLGGHDQAASPVRLSVD